MVHPPLSARLTGMTITRRSRLYPALVNGFDQGPVVMLVLVGVRLGEITDRAVEGVGGSEVGRDGDAVAGPRVRAGERPPADPAVGHQVLRPHRADVERALAVVQLADVDVSPAALDAGHPVPPQEGVAGLLHESLTGHHTLALVAERRVVEEPFED